MEQDEITLDAVKPEDRSIVRDVVRVMQTLKICTSWSVQVVQKGYEVHGWVQPRDDKDISLDDLEMLEQINPLRVNFSGLRVYASPCKVCILVRVLSTNEPVMLHEKTLVRVRKRSRWWGSS